MAGWLDTLRQGLARTRPEDRLAGAAGYPGPRAGLQNLKPFLRRHWPRAALGAGLILLSTLLGLLAPLISRYLVDDVILAGQVRLLLWVALALALVRGLGLLLEAWQQYTFTRFEQGMLLDIQEQLLERTLRLPQSFFDAQEVGYLMSRLTSDVSGLRWFFSATLVYLATDALRLLGSAAFLFYLEWRLALVALVVLPALVLGVRFFRRRSRILSHQAMERQAQVSRQVQESLSAASLIKAFATEGQTVGQIMSEMRASFQVMLENLVVGSAAGLVLKALSELSRGVVLLAGAYLVIRGDWTLGSLLAFQSYLGYVYGPAQSLATANLQVQNALAALERVSALFGIVPEENLGTGRQVEHLQGEVEFRQVSFSYDSVEPVLDGLSCHVRPGERVAVVGPSGVGKTTLVSLIMRFYRPTQGEIWFDGVPASEYELGSLRRRIGYVAQSPLLLSGTILDNLRYGSPEAGPEQVRQAAAVAGIHDFIETLPEGYLSAVGERGVKLSEGQKQRLALARALLKQPDILILDEPTSALDSLTERSIFDALPALVRDKTLFVVAHRLATVQSSDRILLLSEKKLVAAGTHQELLDSSDYYRSLVANQQILAAEPPPPAAS